jgi:hypothetical protein
MQYIIPCLLFSHFLVILFIFYPKLDRPLPNIGQTVFYRFHWPISEPFWHTFFLCVFIGYFLSARRSTYHICDNNIHQSQSQSQQQSQQQQHKISFYRRSPINSSFPSLSVSPNCLYYLTQTRWLIGIFPCVPPSFTITSSDPSCRRRRLCFSSFSFVLFCLYRCSRLTSFRFRTMKRRTTCKRWDPA